MFHLHIKEGIAKALFVAAAGISVLAVALICVFLERRAGHRADRPSSFFRHYAWRPPTISTASSR